MHAIYNLMDPGGNWLGGFSIKLGSCSEHEAKLWEVIHGLILAWEKGFRYLEVEVDSLSVNRLLNENEKR